MVNNDRIVPVQKIDLLSLYATVMGLANITAAILKANGVEGIFSVTGSGSAGTFLANQPVKTLDFPAAVTGATVYFVAGYDFAGLKVAGAAPTFNSSYLDNDDVLPDGVTLYKAVLSGGTVTMTAVTPVIE
ncbi:MAG: hypothetical protein IKQ96_08210 [Lachnospiraceae bacterium]|nr:hypothetical protein [Lachnospiraceae bacterium]